MNAHIVLGLFALYVAMMSLALVLAGRQDALLAQLRSFWGRSLGHGLYFVSRVALPALICVLCLGLGVSRYDGGPYLSSPALSLQLNLDHYRDLRLSWQKQANSADPGVILYGA